MRIDAFVSGCDDSLAEVLSRNRFDACVALQDEPNEHPLIAAVVTSPERLQRFRRFEKLSGVSVRDLSTDLLEEAQHLGLAVVADQLPPAFLLEAFPDVRVGVRLQAGLAELSRFGQLHALMIVDPPGKELASAVLHAFGPERCMFASGWPECPTWKLRLASFTQAHGALPQPVRERLLGGTAAAFYGIYQ